MRMIRHHLLGMHWLARIHCDWVETWQTHVDMVVPGGTAVNTIFVNGCHRRCSNCHDGQLKKQPGLAK